jgi:hypothetical protein
LASFLESIPYLALDADISDFAKTAVIGTWSITVERVAIGIGMLDAENDGEVDLVLQSGHG